MITEAASQDSAAVQIRSRFLQPLGLTSTYMEGSEPASGERAHGFSTYYTGSLNDITTYPLWPVQYPVAWTAGAMTATAYDTARWIRALYGGHVLNANSIAQMTTWTSQSGTNYYGLGTARFSTAKGEFWGHNGVITGYLSRAGHSPTRQVTVVVLVNQDVDVGAIWDALISAL